MHAPHPSPPAPRAHRFVSAFSLQVPILAMSASVFFGRDPSGAAWTTTAAASAFGACLLWGRSFPMGWLGGWMRGDRKP